MKSFLPRAGILVLSSLLIGFAPTVQSSSRQVGIAAISPLLATIAPTPPVAPQASVSTTVDIDANSVVRTVDDRLFGVNTAVWDSAFNNPETLPLLKEADVRALRFPGGSSSDAYSWSINKSYDTNTGALGNFTWSTTFDNFAATAVALGAKVFITANYGSGTAQDAADWVAYSKSKGYGFKYWEIGNECYGGWEYDTHAIKNDPFTYATLAVDFITKMKAADATIKVGVVVIDGEDGSASGGRTAVVNPRTQVSHTGWTPIVLARLKALGVTPDYVIYHRYPYGPGNENDAKLLSGVSQGGSTWATDAAGLRQQVNDYLGPVEGPKVELDVTENNSVYSGTGKQTTSLVNGLFYADSLGSLMQTEFTSMIWWCLRNGPQDKTQNNSAALYGWRNYGDYGIVAPGNAKETPVSARYPAFYMMKLLSHFARGGDQLIAATSHTSMLSSYAAKRADGTLTILTINKSPTDTVVANFGLQGFSASTRAAVRTYGIPQDEAARTGLGSPDIGLSSLGSVGSTFQASFGPYSATVITIYPSTIGTSRIVNLSVRATAGVGAQTLIVGFVVGGAGTTGQLPVLVTGLGPKLASLGVTGALTDPQLSLHLTVNGADSIVASDDNWGDSQDLGPVFARLGSPALTAGSLDAALYVNVDAKPYTAAVNTVAGSGIALAEVYDGSTGATAATPRLVNIAGRAQVNTGDNVLIAGFVVSGAGPKTVLIRGLGPRLADYGVTGPLASPKLELHTRVNGQDSVLATNTAWGGSDAMVSLFAQLGALNIPSVGSNDTAMVVTLDPGVYSAVVGGVNNSTGVALVEIYEVQ
jgi:hypothetical protein